MTWSAFRNRGEILRAVSEHADQHRDGILPTTLPGVHDNFADDVDLVGALLLKWHARLSGNLERALAREPMALDAAVASAWRTTAQQMPGVRLVVDRCVEEPATEEMAHAMRRAQQREWVRLAVAAGLAGGPSDAAVAAGRRLEERARTGLDLGPRPRAATVADVPAQRGVPVADQRDDGPHHDTLVERIRRVLAAA